MGETIQVKSTAPDGFAFAAYHAAPAGTRKGGVVVVQEIFGIDEHVRRDVDRWASLGFEALAPSLYDRREKGFVAGHDEAGMGAGIGHARGTPLDQALAGKVSVAEGVDSAPAVRALATLPSLDELRGKIIGLIQAPATKLAGLLQAPAGQLARVLAAHADQGEGEAAAD